MVVQQQCQAYYDGFQFDYSDLYDILFHGCLMTLWDSRS